MLKVETPSTSRNSLLTRKSVYDNPMYDKETCIRIELEKEMAKLLAQYDHLNERVNRWMWFSVDP